ncbi:[Fe-Fe] hydrogenase large subunit C-terminal domain-containing protein [Lachnospiraceae bacterium LCP25S3_G4]
MKVIDFQDASCKHCYKCVRHCSVKAISVKNEQAHILEDHCIHCGRCLEVCPQNAKKFSSDLSRVQSYLKQGLKTVISVAPSYLGVLEYKRPGQVVDALQRLGFYEVRETAEGASLVTKEYKKILQEHSMRNIITTCCPGVNDLIEKYYPDMVDIMAPVVSPMIAHGRYIKQLYGEEVKVVFLGPCIAKKQEAIGDKRVRGAVDAILTFEELAVWLEAEEINVYKCKDKPMGNPNPNINRLYPISGGIIQSVLCQSIESEYHKVYVDGLDACMEMLESIRKGEIENCFIEANICTGGCVKGPASGKWNKSFVKAKIDIEQQVSNLPMHVLPDVEALDLHKTFADCRIIDAIPTEEQICDILRSTGKYSTQDELNCGACGYATCREKAVAVFQKKAEVSMCLPYALTRAESMSNIVMDVTPNVILIIDRDMRIRECNKKAQKIFGISRDEALERYIYEFIEAADMEEVLRTKRSIIHKKVNIEQIQMKAEETIVYIDDLEAVLVIFQDVTKEEQAKLKHYNLKMETVEMAQKVIDKQMMVAQEIAGLLGETTAETKVTLSKLRDSILFEEED